MSSREVKGLNVSCIAMGDCVSQILEETKGSVAIEIDGSRNLQPISTNLVNPGHGQCIDIPRLLGDLLP